MENEVSWYLKTVLDQYVSNVNPHVRQVSSSTERLSKEHFVVCDNGFLQIFYNCSNVEEIFFGTIEYLICRKMCSKNFENWFINKKVIHVISPD